VLRGDIHIKARTGPVTPTNPRPGQVDGRGPHRGKISDALPDAPGRQDRRSTARCDPQPRTISQAWALHPGGARVCLGEFKGRPEPGCTRDHQPEKTRSLVVQRRQRGLGPFFLGGHRPRGPRDAGVIGEAKDMLFKEAGRRRRVSRSRLATKEPGARCGDVKMIARAFGGNQHLEGHLGGPAAFEGEERLAARELDIPVFHDDPARHRGFVVLAGPAQRALRSCARGHSAGSTVGGLPGVGRAQGEPPHSRFLLSLGRAPDHRGRRHGPTILSAAGPVGMDFMERRGGPPREPEERQGGRLSRNEIRGGGTCSSASRPR